MPLEPARYTESLATSAPDLIGLVSQGDPDTLCGTCPGWTLDKLASHMGRVWTWAAAILESRAEAAPARDQLPARHQGQTGAAWLEESWQRLAEALEEVSPEDRCWNFVAGGLGPATFWHRRQAHETLVHRTDAELALGAPVGQAEPELAADGVEEWLELSRHRLVGWDEIDLGGGPLTVHFHATDIDGAEWTVDSGHASYARAHLKADVAVRGPAWSIFRWCWGRLPDEEGLEIFGDHDALEAWRPLL